MSDENEVQEQFNEKYLDINIDDSELDSDTQIDLYINNKNCPLKMIMIVIYMVHTSQMKIRSICTSTC